MESFDERFRKINERLAVLEVVHTRYQGPAGKKGDKGDPGPAGRDGKDSTAVEINLLRDQRNQITEELNAFRRELESYRTALHAEIEKLYREYETRLGEIYSKGAGAFAVKN